MSPPEYFETQLDWLRENYARFRFFTERDLVWTLQARLVESSATFGLRIFHDYPIAIGRRRALCADIALLNVHGEVEVAAEFKYEPSHSRPDIWPTKMSPSVVFWREGVVKDCERVRQFVSDRRAATAYFLLIDEGSFFRRREPPPGSHWEDWGREVSVLRSRINLTDI